MKTKKTFLLLAALLISTAALQAQNLEQNLRKHVYYLADDELHGRAAGSADAAKAAEYITEYFQEVGLSPFFDTWEQTFNRYDTNSYRNVIGWIEGSDPELKKQYIVVGAHYDHLGIKNGRVYNGADDNASGTATIIELARLLKPHQNLMKYSVIFCAFDGEEIGLWGSSALADTLARMGLIRNVKAMFSIDMVGWYGQSGFLRLAGVGTLDEGRQACRTAARINDTAHLNVKTVGFEGSPVTATDTEPFARFQIPTLAVTTGLKSPYHKPEDDADLIDYEGMAQVTQYLADLVLSMAAEGVSVEPSGKVAYKHRNTLPKLQCSAQIGLNANSIRYPEAALLSQNRKGFDGGIGLKWNLSRHYAIQTGLIYNADQVRLADESDPFGNWKKGREKSLTIPLLALIPVGMPATNCWFGIGGCYTHTLSFKDDLGNIYNQIEPNRFGIACQIGFSLGRFAISIDERYPIGRYLLPGEGPECKKMQYSYSFSYTF